MGADELMLYVSCAGTREIVRFAMDRESGALVRRGATALPDTVEPAAPAPSSALRASYRVPLALSPGLDFLYAVLRTEPYAVLSYRVDPETGALALLGRAAVPASTPYVHADRSGRLLFGAAYQGDCVWVSAIGGDGVAGAPHQLIPGIHAPHCVLPHPDNRTVYVAAASGDAMYQFRLDQGRLEPLGEPIRLPELTRPRHLAFSPGARRLYCITETHALIDVYAIDAASGALTPMPGLGSRIPAEPGSDHTVAADLHFTPGGRFLYGSERTLGTISAFAVDPASGALRHVGKFPTDRIPRSFAIDPSGRFIVSAGQETGRIAVHAIDGESGALGEGVACEVGAGPAWVQFIDIAAKGQATA
jgi:6-phosphogluconolactonase